MNANWGKSQERRKQIMAELKALNVYSKRFKLVSTVDLMDYLLTTKLARLEETQEKMALESYDAGYADGSYNMLINLLDAKVPSVLEKVEGIGPKRMEAIKAALADLRAAFLQERNEVYEALKQ
jgi:hypothetical protein